MDKVAQVLTKRPASRRGSETESLPRQPLDDATDLIFTQGRRVFFSLHFYLSVKSRSPSRCKPVGTKVQILLAGYKRPLPCGGQSPCCALVTSAVFPRSAGRPQGGHGDRPSRRESVNSAWVSAVPDAPAQAVLEAWSSQAQDDKCALEGQGTGGRGRCMPSPWRPGLCTGIARCSGAQRSGGVGSRLRFSVSSL